MSDLFNINFKNSKLASKLNAISESKKDRFFVLFVYIAGVLFYFFLGNYTKVMTIYADEMLYYGLARSIFQGKGLIVRGLDFGFTKIGYPLLISPFFAISNVELRITLITLFNCMLMMSSVFIAYNIAKDINMKRNSMHLFLIVLALWPGLLISETFMSEVLYFPLVLLFVMLWIKEQKTPEKILYPVLEGVVCFWGYMTKELFLSVFITYFLIKIMYPFVAAFARDKEENVGFGKAVRSGYSLKKLRSAVIFGAVFAALYILSTLILSGTGKNFYQDVYSRDLGLYNIIFLFYGIIIYLGSAVIATLVFPFILPLIMFKKSNEQTRKLTCFVYCALAVTVAVISYSILINEDVGNILVRIHFRYINPYFVLIMLIFFAVVFDREKLSDYYKSHSHTVWLSTIFAVIFSFTFFTGIGAGSRVDQYELGWFAMFQDTFGTISSRNGGPASFRLYSIILFIIFLVFAVIGLLLIKHKKHEKFCIGFAVTLFLLSSVNLSYGHNIISLDMAVDMGCYPEIKNISKFVDGISEDDSVLYIIDEHLAMRRGVDTYIDRTDNSYYVTWEFALDANENSMYVNSIQFVEQRSGLEYDTIERIDYIIYANSLAPIKFTNVELVPEASGAIISTYRNLDNTTLNFKEAPQS